MIAHEALNLYFERKKKSSPGFSLRALAQKVEISPSFLSRILSGEKSIPAPLLKKLARVLDIEPELLSTVPKPSRKKPRPTAASAGDDWAIAPREVSQILRNWYYVAVLELVTLADFDGTIESISTRLNLSLPSTEVAVRELLSLNLLKIENNRLMITSEKMRVTSSTSTHLIRKFHDDLMEQCQLLLRAPPTDDDFQKRLVAGVTVSCTPEAVQAAKRKLNQCLYEIANDLTSQPGTEVYHLATQLFPLTKR